ncbi:hypothetical protein SAMN02745196_02061 [Clostridium collagenovorans DSM 3089]|uniref:ABC-2 family transporter protein n=1 Tax=Clostridium collagenovorans DSM 3089 TaxID=1121306 RepID=A0A1M5X8P9_9CLOT|nr:hypothetical protein [Clostridium collagenovorans]SHH95583.1 hypothetical protein SAMN02745196_02061 [Clostridium collagenovorans DSM 3089]
MDKKFMVSIIIGIVFCLINTIKYDYGYINNPYANDMYFYNDFIKNSLVSAYDNFIMFRLTDIANIFFIIMPILVAIPYSSAYNEDIKSGFSRNIFSRNHKKRYLISKFIVNFVISGLTFAIPLIFNLLVNITTQASINPERLSSNVLVIGNLFPHMYLNNLLMYTILWIFIYFISAGVISSIALGVSSIISNKFIIVIAPFIVVQVIGILFPFMGLNKFNISRFLYLCPNIDLIAMSITLLSILTVSFIAFYFGGSANENF